MNSIVKEIPSVLAMAIDPNDPKSMDQQYPYMHNLFNDPNVLTLPDPKNEGKFILVLIGQSHFMESLDHAVFYGGMLGRYYLTEKPHLRGKLSEIILINMVKYGGVPQADPEDGQLQVRWPGETMRYTDEDGNVQIDSVDILASYLDSEKIKDPHGDMLGQFVWLWHGGDPDEVDDSRLSNAWKDIDAKLKEEGKTDDESVEKERLSIWKNFR